MNLKRFFDWNMKLQRFFDWNMKLKRFFDCNIRCVITRIIQTCVVLTLIRLKSSLQYFKGWIYVVQRQVFCKICVIFGIWFCFSWFCDCKRMLHKNVLYGLIIIWFIWWINVTFMISVNDVVLMDHGFEPLYTPNSCNFDVQNL